MKSQVSTEFMFMIIIATAMIVIFMLIFSEMYQDNITDKKRILATDYGYSLQNEFIMASESRPGYIRTFNVPETLEGHEYNVLIIGTTLIINYTDSSYAFPIPPVTGFITKGNNVLKNDGNMCLNC